MKKRNRDLGLNVQINSTKMRLGFAVVDKPILQKLILTSLLLRPTLLPFLAITGHQF